MEQDNLDKLQLSKDLLNFGSGVTGAMNVGINYNILQGNFENLMTGAEQIRIQALERANQLRESFNQAIGDYAYRATQRGFKVSSGSVQGNIEKSAINLGKDIATTEKNVESRAKMMENQAKRIKSQQGLQMISDIAGSVASFGRMSW